jgi:hypothetical protein
MIYVTAATTWPAAQRTELRKRHQAIMLAIVSSVLRRQLSTAWSAWRSYTLRKRQQQQDLQEVGAGRGMFICSSADGGCMCCELLWVLLTCVLAYKAASSSVC